MAQATISVTESQLRCPVCLDLLRDPASIPCGHTYCMGCIGSYWDRADSGFSSCPRCRETFSPRPVLRRNTVLAEVVDRLQPSEAAPAPEPCVGRLGEVPCDFCLAENKLRPPVRSCLVCLASLCELHVRPHRELGPSVARPAERLCAQHRRGLEPAGEVAQWTGTLQETQRTVQGWIQSGERELDEFQQSLESLKVLASAVLDESEALFADMALGLEKTKAEVRARLELKERAVVGRAERELETLENDLRELRRRDEEIGQLLQTDDNAHFLQAAPRLCIPLTTGGRSRTLSLPTEAFSGARTALCHLRNHIEEVCWEEVDKIGRADENVKNYFPSSQNFFSKRKTKTNRPYGRNVSVENVKPRQSQSTLTGAVPATFPLSVLSLQPADQRTRAAFLRFSCRLSLDSNTAHPTLALLNGCQGAHCGEEPQCYPPHPHHFDSVAQVLCKKGQCGGASYWEVEWRGRGWIDIGVTYRSIGRKGGGKPCLLGRNENSWRLRCTHAGYAAWHDNRKTTVAAPPCSRIGVFLEQQKGALSFYSLSDTVVLLHTFRCLFTQPLYPAFRLDLDSTLLICPHELGNGNPS
ncbi:hypothetical protein Q5P01_025621 [Channa striata]|uniref:Uncharacterized protein n=1 Tax=Channa striata TaxID=64152 RepID=A0AA88INS1_CHASR|nr:hypothetical protein Q5P01_025621 [Channa striata]